MQQSKTCEFSELQHHAMAASCIQVHHTNEVLAQSLPGRETSVGVALSTICASHSLDSEDAKANVRELIGALSDVGLRLARKVPGLILSPREARLYVQPRLLLSTYPHLGESIPHTFAYSLLLDADVLREPEYCHENCSSIEDWPENNEFMPGGRKGEEAAIAFEVAMFGKVLPKSGIRVESGLDELCAALPQEDDGELLKRCDAIHLELEMIGVRFHRFHAATMHSRRGPRDGFLFVTNSAQLVRVYPDLAELLPYLHFEWPYGHLADSAER